jgi:hypothetical protein
LPSGGSDRRGMSVWIIWSSSTSATFSGCWTSTSPTSMRGDRIEGWANARRAGRRRRRPYPTRPARSSVGRCSAGCIMCISTQRDAVLAPYTIALPSGRTPARGAVVVTPRAGLPASTVGGGHRCRSLLGEPGSDQLAHQRPRQPLGRVEMERGLRRAYPPTSPASVWSVEPLNG